jgi:hypothetical protein
MYTETINAKEGMAYRASHYRVDGLTRRTRQVSHAVSAKAHQAADMLGEAVDIRQDQASNRLIGWCILTASLLGFFGGYTDQSALILLTLTAFLGVWLIIRSSGLIDLSDSRRQLAALERTATAHLAHDAHRVPGANKHAKPLITPGLIIFSVFLFVLIGTLSYTLAIANGDALWMPLATVSALSVAAAYVSLTSTTQWMRSLLIGACYVAALFVPSVTFGIVYLFLFTLFVYWANRRVEDGARRVIAAAVGIFLLADWTVPAEHKHLLLLESFRMIAGLALAGLLAARYIKTRRSLKERDLSQAALMVAGSGAVLTLLASGLSHLPSVWPLSFASVGVCAAAFAYVAWDAEGRLSYAKYFLTVALLCVSVSAYFWVDAAAFVLFAFMVGVAVSTVGFTMPSYSARLVGMSALAIAYGFYMMTVLGVSGYFSASTLASEQLWIGLLFAVFLPSLASWYRLATTLRGMERLTLPAILLACYSGTFFVLFGLVYFEAAGVLQSVLWIILGSAAIGISQLLQLWAIRFLGGALLLTSLIKLLFSDLQSASTLGKVLTITLVVLALAAGLFVREFRRIFLT